MNERKTGGRGRRERVALDLGAVGRVDFMLPPSLLPSLPLPPYVSTWRRGKALAAFLYFHTRRTQQARHQIMRNAANVGEDDVGP